MAHWTDADPYLSGNPRWKAWNTWAVAQGLEDMDAFGRRVFWKEVVCIQVNRSTANLHSVPLEDLPAWLDKQWVLWGLMR